MNSIVLLESLKYNELIKIVLTDIIDLEDALLGK